MLAGQHDTQNKRSPPPKPIPVVFPSLNPPTPSIQTPPPSWTTEQGAGIPAHFLALKKPSDVTQDTLALLNVTFQPECDFETLLSSLSNNAQSHLPPRSWLNPPEQNDSSFKGPVATLLSNGRRVPDQREFYMRAKELTFKNNDAFSTLTRKGGKSHTTPRLAHFRKFWEGLDNMAYYWDNSLDEYVPPDPEVTNNEGVSSLTLAGEKHQSQEAQGETKIGWVADMGSTFMSSAKSDPRKKAKLEAVDNQTVAQSLNSKDRANGLIAAQTSLIVPSGVLPERIASPKVSLPINLEPLNKPIDPSNGSYQGYRIGNGAEMPDQYRVECVRAFVESIAWAFGVSVSQHRRPPVLPLGKVRFPVRMSSVAYRGPQDRAKARQGWMEGPVLGIQCRPDVNFGSTGMLDAESVLDAVRELGAMLLLAQERIREGKTEKRSGEGKWWTTKERWGGGPGGETQGTKDTSNTSNNEDKSVLRNRDGSRVRRRPSPVELWKVLKTGNALWDPKITYERIGKDRSTEWDDVFMVSSLNHHISVLKLRVHPLYLQFLTEGHLPEDTPPDADWCSPKLQRTRWYDLFDVDDRTEAMRGIWGVLSYLMRAQEDCRTDTTTKDA
ncbi:hypothetical protein P153DRAFT_278828 [Dothidotthia symphoricarpi CBS 119687]|uniref:Uncharacterized protein n=1 Tax=Dothidotthia symphoricarpi CBS 119687 TaxID=1392245 RepID=A0A6A6ARN6_9PLEO|nr:uncharacterized protein P153DRAFT_278828 [Dothidotthia symphoricarpi CBS 119687]KAF2134589.1 hypothetical protein P153DRAFT_278828 [Dothidotthia symphoricarpi CBS 119687]